MLEKRKIENFEIARKGPIIPIVTTAEVGHVTATRRQGERARSIDLIGKYFKDEVAANAALHTFNVLKKIGIKILPTTYRQNENDRREVFMTDFNRGNKITTSSNTLLFSTIKRAEKVDSFDNNALNKALNTLTQTVLTLGKNLIYVPSYAYFFSRPMKGGGNVTFEIALGDLDGIEKEKPEDTTVGQSILANAASARTFIVECAMHELRNALPDEKVRVQKVIVDWYTTLEQLAEEHTEKPVHARTRAA